MANTIKLKRSAVPAKVPTTGDLQLGELALNTYDGKLYTLKNDGVATIVQIGATATTPNSLTFNNSGSGGVSGSTFDGNSALTVSYNTIGAPSTTGTNASGTWGISITGSAATLTTTRTIWGQNFNGGANVSGNLTAVGNITGTGAVTLTATSAALNLTATGANNVVINTNGSERARVDSTGRLLVGTNTARTSVFGNIGYIQVEGDSRTIQLTHNGNNVFSNAFTFIKTRGTGTQAVQSGDSIGLISWQATDGSSYVQGAEIIAYVDATPGASSMPTKLSLRTTPSGGSAPLDRLVIKSTGDIGIGTASPGYKLEVVGSFAATTKSFVIPHPTREGYKLRYGSLEGPENGVYVRGRSKDFVIELPEYWTELVDADSITVNLTPIGKTQTLWVKDIKDNRIYVGSKCSEINYFYMVSAERTDVEKLEVEVPSHNK
jgi:hypothetical protein